MAYQRDGGGRSGSVHSVRGVRIDGGEPPSRRSSQVHSRADRRLAFLLVRLARRRLHGKAKPPIDRQVFHEEKLGFLLTDSESAISFAWKDQTILAGLLLRGIHLGKVRTDLFQEAFEVLIEIRHFKGKDRQAREKSR